jgi:WD40 repeat protein
VSEYIAEFLVDLLDLVSISTPLDRSATERVPAVVDVSPPPISQTTTAHLGPENPPTTAHLSPQDPPSPRPVITLPVLSVVSVGTADFIIQGYTGPVIALYPSRDGTRIFSASSDGMIHVLDALTGATVASHRVSIVGILTCASFSSDGRYMVCGHTEWTSQHPKSKNQIQLVDMTNWEVVASVSPAGILVHASFASSGEYIVTHAPGSMTIWHHPSLECRWQKDLGYVTEFALAPSSDGRKLAVSNGQKLRVYELRDRMLLSPFKLLGPAFRVDYSSTHGLSWSPDSWWLAVATSNHGVRIWNTHTLKEARSPIIYMPENSQRPQRQEPACALTFSPDSECIATAHTDSSIFLHHRTGQVAFGPLMGHRGRVRILAFSPDGKRLISASEDHTVRFWTLPSDLYNRRSQ